MRETNPTIENRQYANGKPYWRVRCTIPGEGRYQRKHSTEEEAAEDRMRLIRQYQGGGLDIKRMRSAEMAFQKLEDTDNPDAKGKDILTAVEWFIENYKVNRHERSIDEYVVDFVRRKKMRRSAKTVEEIEYYLSAFRKVFGSRRPSDVAWTELEQYLEASNHAFHRYKVLSHFFAWLSNEARDVSRLEHPPLVSNPLTHIERPKQGRGRPEICTVGEVKRLVKHALKKGCVTGFIWGFYTGMRPEAEMVPFWKDPEFGWKFVDLDEGKIIVSDEIEKTRRRTREIAIQPNLREWIDLFRSQPERYPMLPRNLKRRFHDVKYAVLPERKAKENDVMRHTFISNLCKVEQIGEVCYQCATSMAIIRKHYRVLITDQKRVREFFRIKPSNFGL